MFLLFGHVTPFSAVVLNIARQMFLGVSGIRVLSLSSHVLPPPDAFPVAVQPAGEAATAEMVHASSRAGEEEGDPGHDHVSVGPSVTFLQLPRVERPEDRLQEVATRDTAAFSHVL